jgi:DNA repair protein RadD
MKELINVNKIKLRYYQKEAIDSVCNESFKNGIIVLPTGAGKSIVIAEICNYYKNYNIVILQPSKEILEQNFNKYKQHSSYCSIFSASLKQKNISRVVFATVRSALNQIERFNKHKESIVIIDECHLVVENGDYHFFISQLRPNKLIGLTATPYRMKTKYGVSYYLLTRTRANIFNEFSYIYQNKQIIKDGFWSPLRYFFENYNYNQDDLEVGNSDFKEKSIAQKNIETCFQDKIMHILNTTDKKHILIFLATLLECEILTTSLKEQNISCETVSSKTHDNDRQRFIEEFKSGKIKVIINVGVLSIGFDFPELDCIILSRPTLSISLYYQQIGRGLRIAKDKNCCDVYDLCGNVKRFGKIEDFLLIGDDNKNLGLFSANKILINPPKSFFKKRNITIENKLEELENIAIAFGKYKGSNFKNIPESYLSWCIENETPQYKEMKKYLELKAEKNNFNEFDINLVKLENKK